LRQLEAKDIDHEIRASKRAIEEELGKCVVSFSYPYAFPEQDRPYVHSIRDMLRAAGYEQGVSTTIGTAGLTSDRYFLPRLPANSYDDPCLLEAKLEGSYDWLHTPQLLYKSLSQHQTSKREDRGVFSQEPDRVAEVR
jgi:hypothetical protein